MTRGRLELALLLAAPAAPLAPPAVAAALLVALLAGWLATRPPRREVVAAGGALLLAALVLVAGALLSGPRALGRAEAAYARIWDQLDAAAEEAAAALPAPAAIEAEPLAAFETLAGRTPGPGAAGPSLLVVDPDGNAVVWSGPGLLHDPRPGALPAAGASFQASFGAVTLVSVRQLDGGRRPWRVIAARSFGTERLPGIGRLPAPLPRARWSVVAAEEDAAAGAAVIRLSGKPSLVVDPGSIAPGAGRGRPARIAWALIGAALLAVALTRGVGLALAAPGRAAGVLGPETARFRLEAAGPGRAAAARGAAAFGLGALIAWGLAARATVPALGVLALGGALAAAGFLWPPRRARGPAAAAAGGAAAAVAAAAGAWLLQRWHGADDLGAALTAEPSGFALRLGLAAGVLGLLLLIAGSRSARAAAQPPGDPGGPGRDRRLAERDRTAWLALGAILAAAAAHDLPLAALPLLAAGGGAAAAWLAARGGAREPVALGLALLAASLLAAGAWETAHRSRLRAELETAVSALAPPGEADLAPWLRRATAQLSGIDLAERVPRSPEGLERQDLAFVLWRSSPLARPDAVSALTVEPALEAGGAGSTFSFGLPLDELGEPVAGPAAMADAAGWPGAEPPVAAGEAPLLAGGRRWGTLRWWLVPRPGFLVSGDAGLQEVEVGLLRGGPAGGLRPAALPAPALFALYGPGGQARVSPWPETPPLPAALAGPEEGAGGGAAGGAGARRARVRTPDGRAWGFSAHSGGVWTVAYLPLLGPLGGLERVATHAAGTLLFLAALALVAVALALPRASFRDLLRRTVRSYSKRLLVVYTLLLAVPLLLLNLVLMAAVEERQRAEQRAAGEAALEAAQRQLAELLEALPPGFGIDTSLDDELLTRLSRLIHHEVNLYWRSAIYASSKAELFAAGLLPRRIPGDVYARLAYGGYEIASRTNRAGRASYLELYSPLRVPGAQPSPGQLVLSVPLLAQQEEAARQLASLRRQAFLVTAALLALLGAVGVRLARDFTRPLMEVVRGTGRIAAGATSLDLAPRDLELAALVAAVDAMARRIAEGRDRLVREKQVVERMVENITSGVVSLDAEGRVLMHNRVAAEMLGVGTGEPLARALSARPKLAPVAGLVAEAAAGDAGSTLQRTLRLPGDDGEEREWSLVWVPVPGPGEPAALLVVEDATETLRGQRLQAWAEMARIIAHEIKNPLTPLRLNIEHLRQVWRDRGRRSPEPGDGDRFAEILDRCTAAALTQVEELRQIASEFSTYSSIPRIDPKPGDLAEAMRELGEGYRAAPPPGVEVEFEARPEAIAARFDRRLLVRAVRNLLENALRASAGGGRVHLSVERLEPAEGDGGAAARIAVADAGPGVAPELLGRIFHPYFSTHDTGTGLGLPIARQIAEEHGGTIAARNRAEGGLEVAITIPLP